MFARVLHLFVCVLLIGPLSAPGWATVRPETRVGGSPAFSSTFASPSASQVAESHQENPACSYDFASGVRIYLYAHSNPVNRSDPSGHYANTIDVNISIGGALTVDSGLGGAAALANHYMVQSMVFKVGAWAIIGGTVAGNIAMVLDAVGPTPQQAYFEQYKNKYFGVYGTCNRYAITFKENYPSAEFVGFRLKDTVSSTGFNDLILPRSGELFKQDSKASANGFHVGALLKGLVFDNNLLGVPLPLWGEEYEIHRPVFGGGLISVNEAIREGWMEMRIFRSSKPPSTRWNIPPEFQWDKGEVLPPF